MIITDLLPKAYVWGKTEKDIMVTMYFSIPSAFVNLRRPLLSLFKAGRGAPSSVCENPPSRSSERGILVHARKTIKIELFYNDCKVPMGTFRYFYVELFSSR